MIGGLYGNSDRRVLVISKDTNLDLLHGRSVDYVIVEGEISDQLETIIAPIISLGAKRLDV